MNRINLIKLVKKIQSVEGTEKEINDMVMLFHRNVPDPRASDYIFQKEYEHLSAEEIVEKALSYNSIQL